MYALSSPVQLATRRSMPSPVHPISDARGEERSQDAQPLVLVVDDAVDVRDLYADTLRGAGFRVVTASDGIEAVELASLLHPRLVLMDLSMPRMDGWEATKRIREAAQGEAETTILAVSALGGTGGRAQAFEAGADGFVEKPCPPDILVSVVQVFIGTPTS